MKTWQMESQRKRKELEDILYNASINIIDSFALKDLDLKYEEMGSHHTREQCKNPKKCKIHNGRILKEDLEHSGGTIWGDVIDFSNKSELEHV